VHRKFDVFLVENYCTTKWETCKSHEESRDGNFRRKEFGEIRIFLGDSISARWIKREKAAVLCESR
jgi:hypothetical protein